MTLDEKLYDEIRNDLLNDFPNITSIAKEENNVIIKADNDTLWQIYDALYKGCNVELNLDNNEESFITLNF